MQPRALVTLALAVVLAGVSVALAHAWLSAAARAPASSPAASKAVAGPDTVPLVVARRALRYGDKLGSEDVKLVAWPKSAVAPGALHALESLTGRPGGLAPVVLRSIAAGEPVLMSKITGFGAPARLAATIAPGLRAVAVRMGGAPDMAALIGPGDRVDVLIAREVSPGPRDRELRSDILLRDVRVLGLDRDAGGPSASPARGRSVTLEVTLEQAQKLAVARTIGTLSLALRGIDGRDPGTSRPVSSHDLPAGPGRDAGLAAEAVWSAGKHTDGGATQLLAEKAADIAVRPAGVAIRVFRGLEASQYEVVPEGPKGTMLAIDAAKAGAGAGPVASEPPR